MAQRQQRNAGIPCRGRPARRVAAGNVRTLPGNRPRQQAQGPDFGGAGGRTGERCLDVLSAAAPGKRATGRPAGNRPAWFDRGPGATGDRRNPGRSDQAAAGTRPRIRCKPHRGGRQRRSALCRGRGAGGVRPARRTASPAPGHGDDAAGGAFRVADRSRLLGPPHAPSA